MAGKLQERFQEKPKSWKEQYILRCVAGEPVMGAAVVAFFVTIVVVIVVALGLILWGSIRISFPRTLLCAFLGTWFASMIFLNILHLRLEKKFVLWIRLSRLSDIKIVLIKVVNNQVVAVSDSAVLRSPLGAEIFKVFFPDFWEWVYGRQGSIEIPWEIKVQHGSTVVRIPVKICLKLNGELTWQEVYDVVLRPLCSNYPESSGSYTLEKFFTDKFAEAVAQKWEQIELAVGEYCVKKQSDAILLQNVSDLIEFADPYLSCVQSVRIVLQRPALEDCRETYCVAIEA